MKNIFYNTQLFIYGYMALDIGKGQLSERGNLLAPLQRLLFLIRGVRCSSVVRAFAHGVMGCRTDPS